MARKYTSKVLELMDEGVLDAHWLAEQLAGWCSEDDMEEFYYKFISNGPDEEDDEEEEEEDDEEEE
jgi:hypothetical protein